MPSFAHCICSFLSADFNEAGRPARSRLALSERGRRRPSGFDRLEPPVGTLVFSSSGQANAPRLGPCSVCPLLAFAFPNGVFQNVRLGRAVSRQACRPFHTKCATLRSRHRWDWTGSLEVNGRPNASLAPGSGAPRCVDASPRHASLRSFRPGLQAALRGAAPRSRVRKVGRHSSRQASTLKRRPCGFR